MEGRKEGDGKYTAMKQSYKEQLKFGREFEDEFARWLIGQGWFVIPKYLYAQEGAPLLIGEINSYAVPDIDCSKKGKRIWVECKRKNKMKYHPATGYPVTNHYCYKKIQEITGDKVFIVFKDKSEEKIYGNWLTELEKHIYRNNWFFDGKKHITFRYPEAFWAIKGFK